MAMLMLSAGPVAAQDESAAAMLGPDEFVSLRFLEGRWIGSGGGYDAFFEAYRFVNDSTLEQSTYPDERFGEPDGVSTIELRRGRALKYRNGQAESMITRIAGDTVRFERMRPGGGGFTWIRRGPDEWTAVLDRPGGDPVVYTLRRIRGEPAAQPPPYHVDHPLDRPLAFANGKIRSSNGIAFTPDGRTLYTASDIDGVAQIHESRFVDGAWTEPTQVPFNSPYHDYQPRLTPDGRRLLFNSRRPMPGTEAETAGSKLWVTERGEKGWGEPTFLVGVNTPDPAIRDSYASVASDGTLYFRSTRSGGLGDGDIYRAEPDGAGGYGPVQPVAELNSPHNENDLFVDPGERFVIFNRYFESTDDISLFISFATEHGWTPPRVVEELETPVYELTPTVSPEGRYFFYELRGTIHQIDLLALIRPSEPLPGGRAREPGGGADAAPAG